MATNSSVKQHTPQPRPPRKAKQHPSQSLSPLKQHALLQLAQLSSGSRMPWPELGLDGAPIYVTKWKNGSIRRAESAGSDGILTHFKTDAGITAYRPERATNHTVWANITFYRDHKPRLRMSASIRPVASLVSSGVAARRVSGQNGNVERALTLTFDLSRLRDTNTVQSLILARDESGHITERFLTVNAAHADIGRQLEPLWQDFSQPFVPALAEFTRFEPVLREIALSCGCDENQASEEQFDAFITSIRGKLASHSTDNLRRKAPKRTGQWRDEAKGLALLAEGVGLVGCTVLTAVGGPVGDVCHLASFAYGRYLDSLVDKIQEAEQQYDAAQQDIERLNREYEDLVKKAQGIRDSAEPDNDEAQAQADALDQQAENMKQQVDDEMQEADEAAQQADDDIGEQMGTDTSWGQQESGDLGGEPGGEGSGGEGSGGEGSGGEGPGGGGCFPRGTLVAALDAPVAIESLRVGAIILGFNIKAGETLNQRILSTQIHRNQAAISLNFGSESIICTPRQPFFTGTWTSASHLRSGDKVLQMDGSWQQLMDDPHQAGSCDVYNLEVAPSQSYFVGTSQLLVHNKTKSDMDGDGDEWWD